MGLIVDTAGGLASHLGPKYTTALKKRNTQLPEVFDNIFFNQSLKRGTFPGESGFLGVKRRSWAGTWQRGEHWQPGWWPRWEQIRADDQMTEVITTMRRCWGGQSRRSWGNFRKGMLFLSIALKESMWTPTSTDAHRFFSFVRPKSDHYWLPLPLCQ